MQHSTINADYLTAPNPKVLWIELTSKCPFDCIFCSRKTLRGNGQHMEFTLFASILKQLDTPDILRLNYSGESIHHPNLIEAISQASRTGALTELVTAFASLPNEKIGPLVRSGLDRLTVSLHTLDAGDFGHIYGFGTVGDMRDKLHQFRQQQRTAGSKVPYLDFAFVAMKSNLDQLIPIATLAKHLLVTDISVHPVIRRNAIPEPFNGELENGQLRKSFIGELNDAIVHTQQLVPSVKITSSTPELEARSPLGELPHHWPGPLPSEANIFSCDQNPWETTHILANGDVVVCEVRDKVVMGNLNESSLDQIWNGSAYREFRREYQLGQTSPCNNCVYKTAYIPPPLGCTIIPGKTNAHQLLYGWHAPEGGLSWSRKQSRALIRIQNKKSQLSLRGSLPPGPTGNNELLIRARGTVLGSVTNTSSEVHAFDLQLPIPGLHDHLQIDFEVAHTYRPPETVDTRELGFALFSLTSSSLSLGRRLWYGK
jgi:MoaA/NifB/PqqE/SkfB family radical SAM enzyme